MPGNHVDVNLHPTKREVGFLHQDELLEGIRAAVEDTLLSSNDKPVSTLDGRGLCSLLHS